MPTRERGERIRQRNGKISRVGVVRLGLNMQSGMYKPVLDVPSLQKGTASQTCQRAQEGVRSRVPSHMKHNQIHVRDTLSIFTSIIDWGVPVWQEASAKVDGGACQQGGSKSAEIECVDGVHNGLVKL